MKIIGMLFGFLLKFVDCENFNIDDYTQLENSVLRCYVCFSNLKECILEIESCLSNMKCRKENRSQSKSKNDNYENLAIKKYEKARKKLKHFVSKFGRNGCKMAVKIIKYYELLKNQEQPNVEAIKTIFRSYVKSGKNTRTRFKSMSNDFIISLNTELDVFLKTLHEKNVQNQDEAQNENPIQTNISKFTNLVTLLDKELVNLDKILSPITFKYK